MDATRRQGRGGWILAGFVGLILGMGIAGTLASSKAQTGASPFAKAGTLPRSKADVPDSARWDERALKTADAFIDGLVKKDLEALAAICGPPFLGGRPHDPRVLVDPGEIRRSLTEDLLRGWEPLVYSPRRSLARPLGPHAFFDRYADHLVGQAKLRGAIEALHPEPSDRMVVEEERGMLIAVRAGAEDPKVIAIAFGGFRPPKFAISRDVIYGRKFGVSLTLDVIQPRSGGNRAAVLDIISDTFVSGPSGVGVGLPPRQQGLLDRGYTIIFVTHSGVPRHPIPEIVGDIRRAIRFVRYHAARLDLDPGRIAVMGGSSAGYLALMAGTAEGEASPFPPAHDPVRLGDTGADPVESASDAVAGVVAYFPVTDWLNYGEAGRTVFDDPGFRPFLGFLDLYDYDDRANGYVRVSDRAEQLRRLKALSPANRAGRRCPPTLLFHGDKDTHVPAQQSESMARALKAAGADVELVIKPGEGHGWPDNAEDQKILVDWLDRHLLAKVH